MPTISAKVVTARKGYRCLICERHIYPGDDHLRSYGSATSTDPKFVVRTCLGCAQEANDPKVLKALNDYRMFSICPRCKHPMEFKECWNCDKSGYSHHDCGEDTCSCLDPEENNVRCYECHGYGGWMICPHCHPEAFRD